MRAAAGGFVGQGQVVPLAQAGGDDRAGHAVTARGVNLNGGYLAEPSDATTVQVRDREVLLTDGPFAETKEQLGGYYLVEARDLDEAIHIASKIPGARHGSIEVRPIMKFS